MKKRPNPPLALWDRNPSKLPSPHLTLPTAQSSLQLTGRRSLPAIPKSNSSGLLYNLGAPSQERQSYTKRFPIGRRPSRGPPALVHVEGCCGLAQLTGFFPPLPPLPAPRRTLALSGWKEKGAQNGRRRAIKIPGSGSAREWHSLREGEQSQEAPSAGTVWDGELVAATESLPCLGTVRPLVAGTERDRAPEISESSAFTRECRGQGEYRESLASQT